MALRGNQLLRHIWRETKNGNQQPGGVPNFARHPVAIGILAKSTVYFRPKPPKNACRETETTKITATGLQPENRARTKTKATSEPNVGA